MDSDQDRLLAILERYGAVMDPHDYDQLAAAIMWPDPGEREQNLDLAGTAGCDIATLPPCPDARTVAAMAVNVLRHAVDRRHFVELSQALRMPWRTLGQPIPLPKGA